jgi:hypothetical protein
MIRYVGMTLLGAMILSVAVIFISSVVIVIGQVYDGIDIKEFECGCERSSYRPEAQYRTDISAIVPSERERAVLLLQSILKDRLDDIMEKPGFGWCEGWDINIKNGEVRGSGLMDLKSCVYVL